MSSSAVVPSDKALRKKIGSIMEGADLDKLTSRQIKTSLESHFGCDLSSKSSFIRSEIKAAAGASGEAKETSPTTELKRKREGQESKPNKVVKSAEAESSSSDDDDDGWGEEDEDERQKKAEAEEEKSGVFELGATKRVSVREWKSIPLIDLREFYLDKGSGEMKPGKKGISLKLNVWASLVENIEAVSKAVSASGSISVDLTPDIRCSVRQWKRMTLVDVREYYTDKASKERKPGKRGLSLTQEQWGRLVARHEGISRAAAALSGEAEEEEEEASE